MSQSQPIDRRHRKILATYVYTNERGDPVYEIIRYEPKDFRIRHKDQSGNWNWHRPATTYPYKVHEILLSTKNDIVFVVEGEKDVETLRSHRLIATTNPFGQGPDKFKPEWAHFFKGRHVMLIPDLDPVGMEHMGRIHKILEPVAATCVIFKLDLPEGKKDVTHWFEIQGNTFNKFLDMAIAVQDGASKKPILQIYEDMAESQKGDAYEGIDRAPPSVQPEESEDAEERIPFKPFPIESLPLVVQEYIQHAARALHCDMTYLALPALCTLGGIIGNTRIIELKETWTEPSVFWGVLIADSSTLKSPALDCAVAPATMIQDELFVKYEKEMEVWREAMEEWKASGGKAANSKEYASKPSPTRPDAERIIVGDITIEKLAEILHKNPRGIILKRDELQGWFGSFGQYKATGGGNDLPVWLEAFRAQSRTIDRKSGDIPTIYVPRFAVTVLGTIQPGVFSRILTAAFFDSGLTSRLLLAMPPKRKKVWSEDVIPHAVGLGYRTLIRNLWEAINKEKSYGQTWPKVLRMTPQAKKLWVTFYDEWAEKQHESEGDQAYALAKLEGYCARFALLFSVVEYYAGEVMEEVVTLEHVRKAITLVQWFANEAERVYALVKNPEELLEEDRLLDFIASIGGEITSRRLLRSNPSKYKKTEVCRALLESLVQKGLGKWEYRKTVGADGRPPATVFVALDV